MPKGKVKGRNAGLSPYFREVRRTELLSREDEVRLSARIRRGDTEARNQLVMANLRFALKMAMRYQGFGLPLEDLVSAANYGLLRAAIRFDGLNGVRFITYTVWWIRQSLQQAVAAEPRTIRLPGHVVELLSRINKVSASLQIQLERQPSRDEIASGLDVPRRNVQRAMDAAPEPHSLDEEIGSSFDGSTRLIEVLKDPASKDPSEELDRLLLKEDVRKALEVLKGREVEVIKRSYGLDGRPMVSLAEIGRSMHLSRERVRQIRVAALERLRREFESNGLGNDLEPEGHAEVAQGAC